MENDKKEAHVTIHNVGKCARVLENSQAGIDEINLFTRTMVYETVVLDKENNFSLAALIFSYSFLM